MENRRKVHNLMIQTVLSVIGIAVTIISIIVTLVSIIQTRRKEKHQKSNRRDQT